MHTVQYTSYSYDCMRQQHSTAILLALCNPIQLTYLTWNRLQPRIVLVNDACLQLGRVAASVQSIVAVMASQAEPRGVQTSATKKSIQADVLCKFQSRAPSL